MEAAALAELRNSELHSSSSPLEDNDLDSWLPKFLSVSEQLASHLELDLKVLIGAEVFDRASAARGKADKRIADKVKQAIENSRFLLSNLTPSEVQQRKDAKPVYSVRRSSERCPACEENTGLIELGEIRTLAARYDEDSEQIEYRVARVVQSFACRLCGLILETTAQCMAAGLPRQTIEQLIEDRYEGGEELMTYEEAMSRMASEAEYMNE